MGERDYTYNLTQDTQTKLGLLGVDAHSIADALFREQPTSGLRKLLYMDFSYVDFLKKKKYLMKLFSELQKYVKLTRVEYTRRIRDIEEWLKKADNVLKDVQTLENQVLEESDQQSLKCCPKWLWQFKLRKKVAKKSRDITELLMNCTALLGYWVPSSSTDIWSSTMVMASKPWNIAYNNVMEALKDNEVSIVALCGMGGVGKTTLAKEVGKKALELDLFDEVVFVHLCKGVNNGRIQLYLASSLNLEFTSGEDRAQQIHDRLENIQSILIILDDVWEMPNLEEIGIPYGGCKILLTSSRRLVCSSMKRERAVELDVLDEEDAWSLFQNALGLSNAHPADNTDKVMAGKEVVKECHGLPFLLLAAGGILREKPVEDWKLEWATITSPVDAFYSVHQSFYQLRSKETKICLLLCSLFPKGSAINVEDLLRYAIGLGLYQEVESIEEVRGKVLEAIEDLKSYYLVLDRGGKDVQMDGLANEYALLTASEGTDFSQMAYENDRYSMTIKPLVDIDKSPLYESFKNCTAIFVMNRKTEPPKNLVWPKLEIMVFGGDNDCYKISRAFLEETEALRQLIPHDGDALQNLINLRTLHLEYCQTVDFSSIGELINLKILSFRGSDICQLPHGIGSLQNLRMLDLYDCQELQMVPSELIQKLSLLEELCIGGPSFQKWPFEVTSLDLKLLPFLHLLSLDIPSVRNPEDIFFPRLRKYQIAINDSRLHHLHPISRALTVAGQFTLSAVRELFCNMQYLHLDRIEGYQNLIPDLDTGGLNELTFLALRRCLNMKNIIDVVKDQQIEPEFTFSELKELIIEEMSCLEKLCNGHPPKGFLQKLKTLTVTNCAKIIFIAPEVQSLEELRVRNCENLRAVFDDDRVLHTNEVINARLLSCLRYLELINLPELMCLWKQPISHISLRRLQKVQIKDCGGMTTLFTSSLAQSLEQLETLKIHGCHALEQIVEFATETSLSDNQFQLPFLPSLTTLEIADCKRLECIFPITGDSLLQLRELDISGCKQLKHFFNVRDADVIKLPHLRRLVLKELTSLSTFSSGNFPVQLRVLQQLKVETCPNLTDFTVSFEASGQFRLEELYLSNVGDNLCKDRAILRRDELPELEYLTIGNNEEIFQLQGGYFLSKMKKLILQKLPNLQVLWKAEMQIVTLQNLTYLEVSECNNLTSIFSFVLVQNLPLLTNLKVKACHNLEQIIFQNQISSSMSIHLKSNCFPRLTEICIEDCKKLKSLFPVSLARLPRLKKFMVTSASNLRQIFGHGNEKNVSSRKEDKKDLRSDEEEIVLPQLEELVLENLPELISFTPLGYYFVLPSLRALDVNQCGKMIMKFITYDSEPRYVRAQIEVSLWPQQGDNSEMSMKRAEINPETGRDIEWVAMENTGSQRRAV